MSSIAFAQDISEMLKDTLKDSKTYISVNLPYFFHLVKLSSTSSVKRLNSGSLSSARPVICKSPRYAFDFGPTLLRIFKVEKQALNYIQVVCHMWNVGCSS